MLLPPPPLVVVVVVVPAEASLRLREVGDSLRLVVEGGGWRALGFDFLSLLLDELDGLCCSSVSHVGCVNASMVERNRAMKVCIGTTIGVVGVSIVVGVDVVDIDVVMIVNNGDDDRVKDGVEVGVEPFKGDGMGLEFKLDEEEEGEGEGEVKMGVGKVEILPTTPPTLLTLVVE